MKNISRRLLVGGTLAALALSATLLAQKPAPEAPMRDLMKAKLGHTQSILEGLAQEDFQLILNHSERLAAIADAPGFQAFNGREYALQTTLFRRNVASLTRAAREKNLDAATLSYVAITMNCVECHKAVRGHQVAWLR